MKSGVLNKALAEHAVDFDPPIYNISEKDPLPVRLACN
jgi:hypothetical protein